MSFMEVQMTNKIKFLVIETDDGVWNVELDIFSATELDAINADPTLAIQYTEGTKIVPDNYPKGIMTIEAYGVRRSAPGYLDCSPWECFSNKKEAVKRYNEMRREDSE